MRVIAVDWSGAAGPVRVIWLAEVADGRVRRLHNGRTREQIARLLRDDASRDPELVVGLDFPFGVPAWFLADRGLADVQDLWRTSRSGRTRSSGRLSRRSGGWEGRRGPG